MLSLVGLAVVLFVSTNVDDVFVLLAFFASPQFRTGQIIVGQYLGICVLLLVSVAASLISLAIAPEHVALFDLLPIVIGLKKLVDLRRHPKAAADEPGSPGGGGVLTVTAATIANGGDNLGVYTPVLATRSTFEIVIIGLIFAVMTAIALAVAYWMVNHRYLGAPMRRYGHGAMPFVLIALGLLILKR